MTGLILESGDRVVLRSQFQFLTKSYACLELSRLGVIGSALTTYLQGGFLDFLYVGYA